jgi:hypothetical protein
MTSSVVIPGRRAAASPESMRPNLDQVAIGSVFDICKVRVHRFQARGGAVPRNDSVLL